MLLTRRDVAEERVEWDKSHIFTYAVILDGKTFETVAEYELYIQDADHDKIENNCNSVYYRQRDDVLFVLTSKTLSVYDAAISLIIIHDASTGNAQNYVINPSKLQLAINSVWPRCLTLAWLWLFATLDVNN